MTNGLFFAVIQQKISSFHLNIVNEKLTQTLAKNRLFSLQCDIENFIFTSYLRKNTHLRKDAAFLHFRLKESSENIFPWNGNIRKLTKKWSFLSFSQIFVRQKSFFSCSAILSFFTLNMPIRRLWTNLYHKEDHFLKIWPLLRWFLEIYLKICDFALFLNFFLSTQKNLVLFRFRYRLYFLEYLLWIYVYFFQVSLLCLQEVAYFQKDFHPLDRYLWFLVLFLTSTFSWGY